MFNLFSVADNLFLKKTLIYIDLLENMALV